MVYADVLPQELQQYVPKNFDVVYSYLLGSNKNEQKKVIYILENSAQGNESYGHRLLLISQIERDGKYSMLAKSDKAIPDTQCGGASGDCFNELELTKNGFRINLYGGAFSRWTKKFTFSYSKRDRTWQLVKAEEAEFKLGASGKIIPLEKHIYIPPRDFGKISINEFDPYEYLGTGMK